MHIIQRYTEIEPTRTLLTNALPPLYQPMNQYVLNPTWLKFAVDQQSLKPTASGCVPEGLAHILLNPQRGQEDRLDRCGANERGVRHQRARQIEGELFSDVRPQRATARRWSVDSSRIWV